MRDEGLDAFADQRILKTDAYVDSNKVVARADIYRYAVPGIAFRGWALARLPDELGTVLDVGCGPGLYLEEIVRNGRASSLIGMDLSVGMLKEVRTSALLTVADAQHIPLRSESIDTVLCMHVLYHVPDIPKAISELRRVLRRGGHLVVATNAEAHQFAIRQLFDEVLADLIGDSSPSGFLSSLRRFRLEDAPAMLGRQFDRIERYDLAQELVIPEVEPVVRYIESIRSFYEGRLPEGAGWGEVVTAFQERVRARILSEGAFRSVAHPGIILCS